MFSSVLSIHRHCFSKNFILFSPYFTSDISKFLQIEQGHTLIFNKFSTESPLSKEKKYDIVVVGGGIIGLGTAYELKKRLPTHKIAVVEKESYLAGHQSGRNSGVIHAGIYYKPGSLRAKLCVEGMHKMYDYCEKNKIPYKKNGKLIVATNPMEVKWLDDLLDRAHQNNVPGISMLDPSEIKEIEPNCVGLKAMHSPYTGIVNFCEVARHFGKKFQELGGKIHLNFKVTSFTDVKEGAGSTDDDVSLYPKRVNSPTQSIRAGFVLTCAGLYSDKLAEMTGESPEPRIIPFRGQYFKLAKWAECYVSGNIYPVPDPTLPFPGVHFTPKLDGSIWVGPTAMLAYKKEGYQWTEYDIEEFKEMLVYKGLQIFVFKHFRHCVYEFLKSVSTKVMLKEMRVFVPRLQLKDLIADAKSGVQAQAMDGNGQLVEDFRFGKSDRVLHCRNTPSPAATSSIAISEHLASMVQKMI